MACANYNYDTLTKGQKLAVQNKIDRMQNMNTPLEISMKRSDELLEELFTNTNSRILVIDGRTNFIHRINLKKTIMSVQKMLTVKNSIIRIMKKRGL